MREFILIFVCLFTVACVAGSVQTSTKTVYERNPSAVNTTQTETARPTQPSAAPAKTAERPPVFPRTERQPKTSPQTSPDKRNVLPPHLSTAGFPRKTGNPYTIFGITYYPLEDVSPDYVEYGIASWYGDDFHGKKTANGEIYNMHDLTAAHRVLPLPTFVRVENLENGKEVIVRLNDRGPFAKERVIDLSYAAAKEIDMISAGTARVRVTVLSEATDHLRTENKDVDIDKGVFLVQIGSFADINNARRHSAGFPNSVINTVNINGQDFYRVQLKYNSRHEAEAAIVSLEQNYTGAFIIAE